MAKKIAIVYGTRPELIKLIPIIEEFKKEGNNPILCFTGQHKELIAPIVKENDLKNDYQLSGSNNSMLEFFSIVIPWLYYLLLEVKPDLMIVQGDTISALAGAQSAFLNKIPVAHVEAGLRSYNVMEPYPEESIRRTIDSLSSYLFTPSHLERNLLIREGLDKNRIYVTGNTIVDSLIRFVPRRLKQYNYILVEMHRRENFHKLPLLWEQLKRVSSELSIPIRYILHYNPEARKVVDVLGGYPLVELVEPMDHDTFLNDLFNCWMVLSDSGGLIEEATTLLRPILIFRDYNERPQAEDIGIGRKVNLENLFDTIRNIARDNALYSKMTRLTGNPFGDGRAAERIVRILNENLTA